MGHNRSIRIACSQYASLAESANEELDPESPEYRKLVVLKYRQRQAVTVESSPPVFGTDVPTIEDTSDEVWHEASERSDGEQQHQ